MPESYFSIKKKYSKTFGSSNGLGREKTQRLGRLFDNKWHENQIILIKYSDYSNGNWLCGSKCSLFLCCLKWLVARFWCEHRIEDAENDSASVA